MERQPIDTGGVVGLSPRGSKAVRCPRLRALTLEIAAWLEIGHWMNPEDDLVRSRGEVPIQSFAADQLGRRWRKVRKKGKHSHGTTHGTAKEAPLRGGVLR